MTAFCRLFAEQAAIVAARLISRQRFILLSCLFPLLSCSANAGFEGNSPKSWQGPEGGGYRGGSGDGLLVEASTNDFARTGEKAVRLMVWDNASTDSICWAGVMQVIPCKGGRQVHIGAWLYFSSSHMPLKGATRAHLKVEYFADDNASMLLPRHIFLSPPFSALSHDSDRWHLVEAFDHAPYNARSMRFSIILSGTSLDGEVQAVWVDDMFVDLFGR